MQIEPSQRFYFSLVKRPISKFWVYQLAPLEGPVTFACKSYTADRQDWYISTLCTLLHVILLVTLQVNAESKLYSPRCLAGKCWQIGKNIQIWYGQFPTAHLKCFFAFSWTLSLTQIWTDYPKLQGDMKATIVVQCLSSNFQHNTHHGMSFSFTIPCCQD